MVRHLVVFRFRSDVPETEIESIIAELRALPDRIPQIAAYDVRRDLCLRESNYDLVIAGDFATLGDFEVYRDHPEHVAVAKHLGACREHSAVLQFDLT